MKFVPAAALLLSLFAAASPAFADACADDLNKVKQALQNKALPPDQKAQLEDMAKQAEALCKAGHTQEGLDVLGDAKAQLNIE
jgi:hypothetical protein